MISEDVTPQLQKEADSVDSESKDASNKLKSRRPVQNFIEMGIPVGSELVFTAGEATCSIISGRKVQYQGEEFSLTGLTKKLLGTDRPLQPSPYWTYEGRKVTDIYNETYESP